MNDYSTWRSAAGCTTHSNLYRTTSTSPSPLRVPDHIPPHSTTTTNVGAAAVASEPLLFSPSSVGYAESIYTTKLQELLVDIEKTEHQQTRLWLNVQPCVLHAVKLVASTLIAQERRMMQMEAAIAPLQQCVEVLISDRQTKEERYRCDKALYDGQLSDLATRLERIQGVLQRTVPGTTEAPTETIEELLTQYVAPLKRRIHALEQQQQPLAMEKRRRRHRPAVMEKARWSSGLRPASPTSSCSSINDDDVAGAVDGISVIASGDSPARRLSPAAATSVNREIMEEVRRLREQWATFLESIPSSIAAGKESGRGVQGLRHDVSPHALSPSVHTACTFPPGKADALLPPPLLSGRRLRWHWWEDSSSPPSAAVHRHQSRSPFRNRNGGSRSPVTSLAWRALHIFDGRTDCWYDMGSWRGHAASLDELPHVERKSGVLWFASWRSPSSIQLESAGVYEVKAWAVLCHTRPSSATPYADTRLLSLCVDGRAVGGLSAYNNSTLLDDRLTLHRPHRSPSPPHRIMRPCSGAAYFQIHTICTHLFLPQGSTIELRCSSGLCDGNSLQEALLEVEYVV